MTDEAQFLALRCSLTLRNWQVGTIQPQHIRDRMPMTEALKTWDEFDTLVTEIIAVWQSPSLAVFWRHGSIFGFADSELSRVEFCWNPAGEADGLLFHQRTGTYLAERDAASG
jgi:hypothetical protein